METVKDLNSNVMMVTKEILMDVMIIVKFKKDIIVKEAHLLNLVTVFHSYLIDPILLQKDLFTSLEE